jgi:AraC-like DNA-binding protein
MNSDTTDEAPKIESTFSQRLRAVLEEQPLSATIVAEAIGVDRRTLSRWLRSEGTSFRHVADEARFSVAKQLLADAHMSLAEISAALGFSEPAAFSHAFRRWTGTTPSAWRKKLLKIERLSSAEDPDGARIPQRDRWRNRAGLKNAQARSGQT